MALKDVQLCSRWQRDSRHLISDLDRFPFTALAEDMRIRAIVAACVEFGIVGHTTLALCPQVSSRFRMNMVGRREV